MTPCNKNHIQNTNTSQQDKRKVSDKMPGIAQGRYSPGIVEPKKGTEFLASSHFTLGMEPKWLAGNDTLAYCSTFKKDYPPQSLTSNEKASMPPPADIMHRENNISDQYCSISKGHFIPKEISRRGYANSTYALTKTNFKMDADKQIESFKTTHTEYFQPYDSTVGRGLAHGSGRMASHIPQGDKDKIQWPESDYQGNFVKHGNQKRDEIINDLVCRRSTIKGDVRVNNDRLFHTTNQSTYQHKYKAKNEVDYSVRYPVSNIPQGDKEKAAAMLSTNQASFCPLDASDYNTADRKNALNKLQSTSFKTGDKRTESFYSTAHSSYQVPVGGGRGYSAGLNMGKSSFPDGDRDPLRSFLRISATVNHSDFLPPPKGYSNPVVDGSKIRTVSNFDFGKDHRQKSYSTTMNESFQRKHLGYNRMHGDTGSSCIPLDYYKNLVHEPTYRTDYGPNRGLAPIRPNPTALGQLKRSHIQLPKSFDGDHHTTHRITYTPKSHSRERILDSGRIQRSSVPLGTLTA